MDEQISSPHSFKPIPKPRKSLMNNAVASTAQQTNIVTAQYLHFQPPADSSKVRLYERTPPPPPPLPPRTPFSISPFVQHRPLPTLQEQIDFSTTIKTNHQQMFAESNDKISAENNINNRNGTLNKIFPAALDKKLPGMASTKAVVTAITNSNNNTIQMDSTSNNSSDLSSTDDYHSVLESPATTTFNSSNGLASVTVFHSYYEPFGDVKSDGESVCFSGWVQMTPQGGLIKHRKRGFAMIRQEQFFITPDDEIDLPFFGPADMCKCVYLGRSLGNDNKEIVMLFRNYNSNGKLQKSTSNSITSQQNLDEPLQCVLRFTPEENGDYWLPLLAKQCCSPRNELLDNCLSLDCFGRLWIKQGISGIWNEGWAFASKRILHYWIEGPPSQLAQIDIRKIILIKRKDIPYSDWCNRIEHSGQGPILIALEGNSLYLQAQNDQCTTNWFEFLTSELHTEQNILEECRLTSDDVPVIVDKCIRLISTYGLNQQGIYRKSGSAAEAKRLMAAFREDPYVVHLKSPITDETVFAVAGVMRTFFRQLNSPLIPAQMHSKLYEISNIPLATEKLRQYQALICTLPKVYFKTLRKLLGHLQEIISHETKNFASLDNISKMFGPTLFNVSNSDEEVSVEWYTMATKQTHVMRDLIFHYCDIFEVTAEELLAKCKLNVIQEQKSSKNPATGLLLPIHLFEKDNKCFNIQSEWTAGQVVAFKLEKLAFISTIESYALFEIIRNGQLERRIGANESLRSIVLDRWLDWEDHQNNYLLLKKDLHPFQPQTGRAFADDLKIAEPGSRTFKSASLRIEEGTRVSQYSKTMKRQNAWKVDELLWFMGAEIERKCPSPFALTFFIVGGIEEKKTAWGTTTTTMGVSKCRGKFPGYCVAFPDEIQRHQWMNCICLNQSEYLPQPLIQL